MRAPRITLDMMMAVVKLAEKKSIEAVGRELGLTPSAVRKRIQAAKQLFGACLFADAPYGLQLTEIGEIFYSHAVPALEGILLLEETTQASSLLRERQLVVGHSTYLPSKLLATIHSSDYTSLLGINLKHKPGLTLAIAQDVVTGVLHAGLGYMPITHPDLLVYPLMEEPVVVCMSSSHPLAAKPHLRPNDLAGESIIATSRETFPAFHQQIRDYFENFGVTLKVVADAFGPHEALTMVEQKMGLCFLSASTARTPVKKHLSPRTLTRRCGLFVRADNRHPTLKSFVDLILRTFYERRPVR